MRPCHKAIVAAALAATTGCGQADDSLAPIATNRASQSAVEQSQQGWGARLVAVFPGREDDHLPSVAALQKALAPCAGPGRRCDLTARPVAGGGPSVAVAVDSLGGTARSVTLTACCSDEADFFRPFESLPVIRTALICPELTIAASDPVQAFRISSPGKRDFAYTSSTRASAEGRAIIVTVHFAPFEPGAECDMLSRRVEAVESTTFQ